MNSWIMDFKKINEANVFIYNVEKKNKNIPQ